MHLENKEPNLLMEENRMCAWASISGTKGRGGSMNRFVEMTIIIVNIRLSRTTTIKILLQCNQLN